MEALAILAIYMYDTKTSAGSTLNKPIILRGTEKLRRTLAFGARSWEEGMTVAQSENILGKNSTELGAMLVPA